MKRGFLLLILLLITVPCVNAVDQFELEISMGLVDGYSRWHKHGINDDIGATFEDIWEVGGTYVFLSTSSVLNVSSTDTDDTLAGTGARTVTIRGLDTNWNELSETVNMNGTANVTTVNSFIRVNRVLVDDVGSSEVNEGDISVTSGAVTVAFVNDDYGRTQQLIFTVPADHTCYILDFGIGGTEDKAIEYEYFYRPFNKSWQVLDQINLFRAGWVHEEGTPRPIPGRSDIKFRAKTLVPASVAVFGHFDLVIVDNSEIEIKANLVNIEGLDEIVMLALFFLTAVASYWGGYVEDNENKASMLLGTSFLLWLVVIGLWGQLLPNLIWVQYVFMLPLIITIITIYTKTLNKM